MAESEETSSTQVDVDKVLSQMSPSAQLEFHVAMATANFREELDAVTEQRDQLASENEQLQSLNEQLRNELRSTADRLAAANGRVVELDNLLLTSSPSDGPTATGEMDGPPPEMTQELTPEMRARIEQNIDAASEGDQASGDWEYDTPPPAGPSLVNFGQGRASSLLTGRVDDQ